jgi:hypothetical protein
MALKGGGKNSDKEFVRLRGRMRVDDPDEKARRKAEFAAYRARHRVVELERELEQERSVLSAAAEMEVAS